MSEEKIHTALKSDINKTVEIINKWGLDIPKYGKAIDGWGKRILTIMEFDEGEELLEIAACCLMIHAQMTKDIQEETP